MPTESHCKENRLITSLITAACLLLLTFGTISVYGIPDNLILPPYSLMTILLCTIILLYLQIKDENWITCFTLLLNRTVLANLFPGSNYVNRTIPFRSLNKGKYLRYRRNTPEPRCTDPFLTGCVIHHEIFNLSVVR